LQRAIDEWHDLRDQALSLDKDQVKTVVVSIRNTSNPLS